MSRYKSKLHKRTEDLIRATWSSHPDGIMLLNSEAFTKLTTPRDINLHFSTESDIEAYTILYKLVAEEPIREFLHLRLKATTGGKGQAASFLRKYRSLLDHHLLAVEEVVLREVRTKEEAQAKKKNGHFPDELTPWERYCQEVMEVINLNKHGRTGKTIAQFHSHPSPTDPRKMRFGNISSDIVCLGCIVPQEMRRGIKREHSSQSIGSRYEIDGGSHKEKARKDIVTDWVLQNYGVYSQRFENKEFQKDPITGAISAKYPIEVLNLFKKSSTGKVSRKRLEAFYVQKAVFNAASFKTLNELDQLLFDLFGEDFKLVESFNALKNETFCPREIRYGGIAI